MSKKAYLLSVGCFILGAILGIGVTWFVATIHYGKAAASGLLTVERIRLMQAGQRATGAYWSESRPVGIYELSQYLATLKQVEKIPDNPNFGKNSTYCSMALTHGRLAKLYAEVGQTNLSAEHIADAISCSKMTPHLVLTNQGSVADFVALWDRVLVRNTLSNKTLLSPGGALGASVSNSADGDLPVAEF